MNKKMGPLKLWQWIAIGVATGAAWYLYKRSHPEAANPEEIVGAVAGGVPSTSGEGGTEGGGSTGGGGGGVGEASPTPAAPERIEVPTEPGQFAEGLLAKIFSTESERLKGAQANARKARAQAKKAREAARKAHKAQAKAEHQHHQKPKSTGGAASASATHHSPPHPATRVGQRQVAGKRQAKPNQRKRR